jgi:hypothetical protein
LRSGIRAGSFSHHSHAFAFSQAARNFAIASSRVAAVPFVTPGVAGTIDVIDHPHRSSGGPFAVFERIHPLDFRPSLPTQICLVSLNDGVNSITQVRQTWSEMSPNVLAGHEVEIEFDRSDDD